MSWNADRTVYYGTTIPDEIEKVLLEAYARFHWLRIMIRQNFASLKVKHG